MVKKALTDAMCGKLTRWLRMIGIDTFYVRDPLFYILDELPLEWAPVHRGVNSMIFCKNGVEHSVCLIDNATYLDNVAVDIRNIALLPDGHVKISRDKMSEDSAILLLSKLTGRVLLTIDIQLSGRAGVPPLPWDFKSQLAEALILLEAEPFHVESRCSRCNGSLISTGTERWKCSRCGHEFWIGSHWKHICHTLEDVAHIIKMRKINRM